MTTQVIHEAEYTRQHARYRVPARLRIETSPNFAAGQYEIDVNEWSVSGLSLKGLPDLLQQKRQLKGQLIFTFGGIDTVVEVELELVHREKDENLNGYRFVNLGRPQLATLHHIIHASLNGDIVDAGGVIEVLKRDAFKGAPGKAADSGTRPLGVRVREAVRRIFLLLVFLSVVMALLAFIGYTSYQRMFVVASMAAHVDGPVVIVRAPQASYFEPVSQLQDSEEVKEGELMATLKLTGGGSAMVVSPCDCRVLGRHRLHHEFVARAEPLWTLFPKQASPYITAKYAFKEVEKLSPGQKASIRLADGEQIQGTIVRILSGQSIEREYAAPLKEVTTNPVAYADVIIQPDKELSTDLLGVAASVKIDTFRQ